MRRSSRGWLGRWTRRVACTAPLIGLLGFGASPSSPAASAPDAGLSKIKHIVIIMQENRSFDEYFGTFPGVDGFDPAQCNPDPNRGRCVFPFHDANDKNVGGPHGNKAHEISIDGGAMDGFIKAVETLPQCADPDNDPVCGGGPPEYDVDVMGWHDAREIPNYWSYAENFVLQDHMFEPVHDFSAPAHQWLVSGWSANCTDPHDAATCTSPYTAPSAPAAAAAPAAAEPEDLALPNEGAVAFPWTDITWLLFHNGVSWRYYVQAGMLPDCNHEDNLCPAVVQSRTVASPWNPLAKFDTVRQDNQFANIRDASNFFTAATTGRLPAVSWVIPNSGTSEHPQALVSAGQAWVTSLINAVMQGPDWSSTAIFVAWDDWGGFYDHVLPPVIDSAGLGLRVPGFLVSPYAKQGYIDSQILSFDSYLKFIEDVFLGGARIDPLTDGRPDPRPTVREDVPTMGDLANEFDFTQQPRQPVVLPLYPPPGPASQ